MRWMLRTASLLTLIIGVLLFFFPTRTDLLFAWTIGAPITASFLGAAYLASSLLEFGAAREVRWANARVAVPGVLLFTTLTLIVTLVHLAAFHFDVPSALTRGLTWVWIGVYAGVPPLMGWLWYRQRQQAGIDATPQPLAAPLRALLGVTGALLLPTGVLLLLLPTVVAPLWPWPLTALTGRAAGAWFVGLGFVALHAVRERCGRRLRALWPALLLFAGLQGVTLLRFAAVFRWTSPVGVLWVALLVALAIGGAYALVRDRARG